MGEQKEIKDEPDKTPVAAMKVINTLGMRVRKNNTSYNAKRNGSSKETYTDRSKSTGRKVVHQKRGTSRRSLHSHS